MKIKREPMKRISKNSNFIAGAVLTGLILLFIIIGCIHTPYDPEAMDGAGRFAGISWRHPMGCDNFGRDILSRVMTGFCHRGNRRFFRRYMGSLRRLLRWFAG